MHEIDDEQQRTVASRADAPTDNPQSEPEWRPDDQPSLAGSGAQVGSTGASPASSRAASSAGDVVPGIGRPPADPRSYVGPEDTPARGVRTPAVPSVANIGGHPLHPTVVPLPIGAFVFALGSDIAYAMSRDRFWARASRILLGTGIATGALAGALGATDFVGRERTRQHVEAWVHGGGNAAALGLSAINLAIRRGDDSRIPMPAGPVLSALTGGLLLLTGWLGGELSYRYRIGVIAD